MPRICSSAPTFVGWRLASSTRAGSAEHRPDRPVLVGRGALAPGRELLCHRPGARVELADARQALPGACRGRARRWPTRGGGTPRGPSLRRPVSLQAPLELVGELEQVRDVLGGVAQLLGGQRPGVPARVAGGLADPAAEHRAEQVAVPGLGARAHEPGGELGVEDVRDLGAPGPAEDRHVLAAGVEHDLDRRVGQQLRRAVSTSTSPRASRSARCAGRRRRARVVDRDLHQAQERAVAALGHELGVDSDAPVRARGGRRRGHLVGAGERLECRGRCI